MKLLSVNVGVPREIEWKGKLVRTSIFKAPVQGRLQVGKLNLDGDQQSDLSVHGGIDKAVYAYPSEHYSFWREELPGIDLPRGVFGENFTREGLLEETVHIGDRFRVSSAHFVVTQTSNALLQARHSLQSPGYRKVVPAERSHRVLFCRS